MLSLAKIRRVEEQEEHKKQQPRKKAA